MKEVEAPATPPGAQVAPLSAPALPPLAPTAATPTPPPPPPPPVFHSFNHPPTLPSHALLKRHLTATGIEWITHLRRRRRAATGGGIERVSSLVETLVDTRTHILSGAVGFAVLGLVLCYVGLFSGGAFSLLVASVLIGLVYYISSEDSRKVRELVASIMTAVEEAELVNHAFLDKVTHRMNLQVVAFRLLLEAVTVCEAGITYYPPSASTVAGEVTSNTVATTSARVHTSLGRDMGAGGLAGVPFPTARALPRALSEASPFRSPYRSPQRSPRDLRDPSRSSSPLFSQRVATALSIAPSLRRR